MSGVLPLRINRKCIKAADLHAALPGLGKEVANNVLTSLAVCNQRFADWSELSNFLKGCGVAGVDNLPGNLNFTYT
jgi:hypothetical protein